MGYFGGFVSSNNYYGTTAGTYQGEFVDIASTIKRTYYYAPGLVEASDGPGDVSTRIISVTPPNDLDGSNARATSTTFAFEATGYYDSADYRADSFVSQKWIPNDYDQLASAYCAIGGCYTEYQYDLTASGNWSIATTTDIQRIGWYSLKTTIYAPHQIFGVSIPLWNDTLTSTSTSFLVATSSAIDSIKHTVGTAYENVITGQESPAVYCGFSTILGAFDFTSDTNILTCLLGVISGLTVPNETQRTAIATNFNDTISTRAPFGYFTRFISLANGSAGTTTLPTLTIGFPTEYGSGLGGLSATFTPWTALQGQYNLLGTATSSASTGGKTLKEIIYPGLAIIAGLLLALAIIWDSLKIKYGT